MKIKINEKEFYEIILPDIIEGNDFLALKSRLDYIAKLIEKGNPFIELPKTNSKKRINFKRLNKIWLSNRDEAIVLLKKYYSLTSEQRKEYDEKYGCLKNRGSDVRLVRQKFNIKPEEVGIKKFTHRGQTLIFLDENGEKTKEAKPEVINDWLQPNN